jgi:outer membrane protein OmpA-like peptidoglycan-associated protein
MKTLLSFALSAVLLGSSASAAAESAREPVGVIGGAIVGAAAGGPIGVLVGAAVGGHYANQADRLADGERELADVTREFENVEAQLAQSVNELERVENALLERSRTLAVQDQRIDQLVEDQMLLSALRLRVRFATDDASITEDDRETLAILARYLAQHPEVRVRLDGHADARGSLAHNDKLSVERARAVAAALAGHEVADEQIDIRGFGEREAAADIADPDRLAAERRVEVELIQPDDSEQRLSKTLK